MLLDERPTPDVRIALDLNMRGLEKSATKTTADTQVILDHFQKWYTFTIELSTKIVGRQGMRPGQVEVLCSC